MQVVVSGDSTVRLVLAVASDFRAAMDRRYRESGITTQQAALLGTHWSPEKLLPVVVAYS